MSADEIGPSESVHRGDPVIVDRYTPSARINHWITATCLVLLALSGLALFHPSLFFLTALFGGGQATRAIHPEKSQELVEGWKRQDVRVVSTEDVIRGRVV